LESLTVASLLVAATTKSSKCYSAIGMDARIPFGDALKTWPKVGLAPRVNLVIPLSIPKKIACGAQNHLYNLLKSVYVFACGAQIHFTIDSNTLRNYDN